MKVAVVGGGNSAHVLIPILAACGHEVSLLTHRPDAWSYIVTVRCQCPVPFDGEKISGRLARVSSVPEEIVTQAEAIILCMPVAHYREAIHNIAPYIDRNREVFLGTLYGQAGFNWMVEEVKSECNLPLLHYFAYGLIPWIARTEEYGSRGVTYGCKEVNIVAVCPHEKFNYLNENLLDDICFRWFRTGKVLQTETFLSLTLSVDNQIIHPSRCYGLWMQYPNWWKNKTDIPLFYRDYDEGSAECLRRLDDDYSKIRDMIIKRYPNKNFRYMLNYLDLEHLSYNSNSVSIRDSFVNSKTLKEIKTPVRETETGRWVIDTGHRFFSDDIGYGLCVAKWFSEKLEVETPMIDDILRWVERLKGQVYLDCESHLLLTSPDLSLGYVSGVPPVYGMTTVDQALG